MKTTAPFCRYFLVLCRASLAAILGVFLGLPNAVGQTNRAGNPLRIPPVWSGGTLTAAPTNQTLWPGFSTGLLAINGSVPSPTIRVQRGSNFTARIDNRLTNDLVMHWHGIVAPPNMDGHPRDAVAPGQTYTVDFPIHQRAGTYFYHPHTEALTGQLVYRGLAGAFIVVDPAEQSLGLPSGDHDVPLLIQDKRLRPDRQLVYEPSIMDTMTGYLGNTVLVNGTPEAFLSVDKSLYRFRVVNGSNARVYKLGFNDGRPFHVIATDGGLLGAPVAVTSAFLAPGERIEILVDFRTNQIGDSVVLNTLVFDSDAMSGMGGTNMMTGGMGGTNMMTGGMGGTNMVSGGMTGTNMMNTQGVAMQIIRFVIERKGTGTNVIPSVLSPSSRYDLAQARRTRTFTLGTTGMTHTINGAAYSSSRVDFQVPLGELEIWEFRNTTPEIHPMHPHGTLFQVLDRNSNTNLPAENLGWKDTVLVWPNETVRVLIRFDEYAGLFVSHCHNLEHGDSGMMQNLEVLPAQLGVKHQGNRLALSYPATATNYVLEVATSFGPGATWTRVSEPPNIAGDAVVVSIPQPSGTRFYRLVNVSLPKEQPSAVDPHAGHH